MNILNQNPLEIARRIDGFATLSLSEIAEQIQDCNISVRIRMAAGVADFVIGTLLETKSIQCAEAGAGMIKQIEEGILRAICPDGALLPEPVRAVLTTEGSDQLRGFKVAPHQLIEVQAA